MRMPLTISRRNEIDATLRSWSTGEILKRTGGVVSHSSCSCSCPTYEFPLYTSSTDDEFSCPNSLTETRQRRTTSGTTDFLSMIRTTELNSILRRLSYRQFSFSSTNWLIFPSSVVDLFKQKRRPAQKIEQKEDGLKWTEPCVFSPADSSLPPLAHSAARTDRFTVRHNIYCCRVTRDSNQIGLSSSPARLEGEKNRGERQKKWIAGN